MDKIQIAKEKFEKILEKQLKRVEMINANKEFKDFKALDKIVIGVCGGDGIGPRITGEGQKILEFLLQDEVKAAKLNSK